jgi:hypothetical protein
MQSNLKNNTNAHLAKSHINSIVKHATDVAKNHATAHQQEVRLNKNTMAVYNLFVVDGNLLDIVVTQIIKA